jgi:hypothetical protein
MSHFNELKRRAETLLAQLERGKEYTVGHVSQRVGQAAANHPQDTVIRAVAGVLESMSRQNPGRLISQAEMDQIYNQLVGLDASGTRFREVLGDLLLSEKPASAAPDPRYAEARRDPLQEALSETEPALAKELGAMFGFVDSHYDPKLATEAREKVGMELHSMGVRGARVRIAGGNPRHLVFAADIDTNRGAIRVYIPVEASGGKLPSVFVAGDRFAELTPANLKTHLEQTAIRGDRLPEVSAVLKSLDIITMQAKPTMPADKVAKIAAMLPENDGSAGLSAPGLFATLPEGKGVGEVEIPRTEPPEALRPLAAEIEESVLEAAVGYPQVAVRLAKRMLLAELAAMGFKGTQVRVAAPTSDGFICEAALNTPRGKIAIDVPIEMRDNQPLMPAVFAQGDKVEDFNEANLKAMLAREPETVNIAVRRDSQLLGMNYHDLKDTLIRSAADGNLAVCDEVMEAIAEKYGPEIYRNTLLDYQKILLDLGSAKHQAESRCGRILRSSTSIFPLCGHFMVPLHKVVQDGDGACHLASTYHARKNQSEEGAFFSNAKVLLGDK